MNKKTLGLSLLMISFFFGSKIFGFEYENIFFSKAEKNLSNLKELQSKEDDFSNNKENFIKRRAKEGLILKELKFFLDKCRFYKLTVDGIRSSELDSLFKQIDGQQYRVLSNDIVFCNKEENELLQEFFNFVRIGIIYELVFDHMVIFRNNLIYHLENLYFLIDYWTKEIDSYSLRGKIKNIFLDDFGKEHLKEKIKKLIFFKGRVASFVGKVDELFLRFAKDINPFLLKDSKVIACTVKDLTIFVEESIFCISSFFSKQFNPDLQNYNNELVNFNNLSLMEKMQQLCKNHIDVLLMEEGFDFVLKEYSIPNFFQRHWFLLSACGVATVTSGICLYKNWDYLMSDDGDSPKNRVIKFSKETSGWITDSFISLYDMIKDKLWPDEQNPTVLEEHKNSFVKKFEETCKKLHEEGLLDVKNPENLDPLFNSLSKFKNKEILMNHNKLKKSHKLFKKHKNDFKDYFDKLGEAIDLKDRVEGELDKIPVGRVNWVISKELTESLERSIPIIENWIKEIKKRLENIKKDDLGKNTYDSVNNLLVDITNMVDSLIPQVDNLGVMWRIYQAIIYKVIGDGLDKLAMTVKTGEVTLNWVKALIPVMLTIIVAPTTFFLIIKGILKSRRKEKIEKVNKVITEIYRILVYYKSSSFDCYHRNLKYKDQGLISFWAEKLKEYSRSMSSVDEKDLSRLISDLKNTNLSVDQKIDFINIEWGNKLFGGNVAY
ncbi:hypothetical protein KAT08_04465 [Candidatus Babeliales bacterium]|nr:hypothetical protein [Candidatus Babeliales bacterium]